RRYLRERGLDGATPRGACSARRAVREAPRGRRLLRPIRTGARVVARPAGWRHGAERRAGPSMIRRADPYRDTDVIDARAPRTNQAVVGTLSLLAVLTGWWPILGVLAGQLAIGLVLGRRYCLPCLLYFEVIQPRIGEGPVHDRRPPRVANVVGTVC